MTQPTRNDPPLWTPPPEFLRELPDMISGKDPELLKPEARAWMLRDPQARELAQQICGAVAMFADMPSRMTATATEPISLRAKRSVERAARQLPQRLAEVLWPLLTLELDRVAAANGAAVIDPTQPPGTIEEREPELQKLRDQLVRALDRTSTGSRRGRIPVFTTASNSRHSDAAWRARTLIQARDALIGSDSVCKWTQLLLHHVSRDSTSRLPEWVSFVRGHSRITTNYHAHVLQTAALAFEAGGQLGQAIDLCELVMREHAASTASGAAAYTGLKLTRRVGDFRLRHSFLRRFQQSLEANPEQLLAWRRQFLLDAGEWVEQLPSAPRLVGELFALLGNRS